MNRKLLLLAFLAAYLLGPRPGAEAALQVRLDRLTFNPHHPPWVNLFVSVADEQGRAVKDLREKHFRLEEDGRPFAGPREVHPFGVTDYNLGFVLALDHREDLPTSLTLVRRGAEAFLTEMGFRYPGAVLTYTDEARVVAGPSRDTGRLAEAVRALRPGGEVPCLFDSLVLSVEALENCAGQAPSGLDRQALVLLTDGLDRGSVFSLAAGAGKVREAEAALFVVGYGAAGAGNLGQLADLARESGGGYFFAAHPDQLTSCLLAVADRLKNQYVLSFRAAEVRPDGKRHRLRVEVWAAGDRGTGVREFLSPRAGRARGPLWLAVLGLGAFVVVVLVLRRLVRSSRRAG